MTLTNPHRTTIRERLRPVIDDDEALDVLMSQFPATDADTPVTLAVLTTELAKMEARLTSSLHDRIRTTILQMLGILLAFTTAYMAIMLTAVLTVT